MSQSKAEMAIRLHSPHTKQAEIKRSDAKRKVLVCGRRFGKTTLVADDSVESALAGSKCLFAAPTMDQIEMYWRCCKWSLEEPITAGHIYKNETRHLLEFPSGGIIRAKTAWDADTLRGDYADKLYLEEYAMMKSEVWYEVGAPMLLDNDGDAWFFSSPKRRNHFHALYAEALQDTTGRWAAWHGTSHDNPYLSQQALDDIKQDMTEEAHRQEILAEFLENEGAVFRNLEACMNAPAGAKPADHEGHRIVAGVDWGKQNDATAVSVVCADCKCELEFDRFVQVEYSFQRKRLMSLFDKWGVQGVLPERNSMGEPIIEQMIEEGCPVSRGPDGKAGFMTTASSKPPLIESLALALEREECQWIDDKLGLAELQAYERTVSARTGRPQYGAPEGVHDDTVIAKALAWWEVLHGGPTVQTFPSLYD